eukprot:CAMPEP_0198154134 /NCGR_PEP_ID=MMETSP1443-20131203/67415_1 /TAXON_ID=186043 /ORGANISM="Entomoneis sp., Strain CCMP2396" /LENGTH=153 /DNA_ID=CAMNT_0043820729 /DNA_START=29 /DNA_END=487 /DNA_ORIENTATION=+
MDGNKISRPATEALEKLAKKRKLSELSKGEMYNKEFEFCGLPDSFSSGFPSLNWEPDDESDGPAEPSMSFHVEHRGREIATNLTGLNRCGSFKFGLSDMGEMLGITSGLSLCKMDLSIRTPRSSPFLSSWSSSTLDVCWDFESGEENTHQKRK